MTFIVLSLGDWKLQYKFCLDPHKKNIFKIQRKKIGKRVSPKDKEELKKYAWPKEKIKTIQTPNIKL